jgi:hypothetical protein
MDVLVTIQHPAHVHVFRHAIGELEDRGHSVHVRTVEKDVAVSLLDAFDVSHEVVGARGSSPLSTALSQAAVEYRLYREARAVDPDVVVGVGGLEAAHVGTLVGAQCVVFTDTEHARLSNRLTVPFADEVCTPEPFEADLGGKQYRYESCHELAYLHPARFSPDPEALSGLPVAPSDTYAVLRSVDWGAAHDVGDGGIADLGTAVERLEAAGAAVFVSAEGDLPPAVADRRLDAPPEAMHDLLYYADLFLGESGTMAAESAVVGTPAVYVHSATPGVLADLADYGLLFGYHGADRTRRAVRTAEGFLSGEEDVDWEARRARVLADKTDATAVIVDRILAAGDRAA